MKYRYISDCHVHSDCSRDAADPTMMMCERASRLGLHALTITDHCECNTYREEEYDRSIRQSFFEAKKAAAVFHDRLHVYCGVELGQPLQNPAAADDALGACNFDFILLSLHNLAGLEDFYYLDYQTVDVEKVMDRYFDELLQMAEWNRFDSLAHLTYPLRYITGERGIEVNLKHFREKTDAILEALARNRKALELNTSGLRQKIGKTMPTKSFVRRFRELGGKYITLGSDAHRWADVGSGIERGLAIIEEAGFRHFTVYVNREPHLLPIE